jgi:hypothetical protein
MIKLTEPKNNDKRIGLKSSLEFLECIPGIWLDGNCYWLHNSGEKVIYEEEIIVKVKQEQVHSKIRLFNLYVSNHSSKMKDIKILVMHHYPHASGEQFSFVSPTENVIYHLANKHVYIVNGQCNGIGMKEYTIQPHWNVFTDRIWSCLEKGSLRYQPMAKGHSASIIAMKVSIEPHETAKISTWSIKGKSKSELISLDKALLANRKG